jgi:hypothetical protein
MKTSSLPLTGPGSDGETLILKRLEGAVCDHPGERATLKEAARRVTANRDFKRILLDYLLDLLGDNVFNPRLFPFCISKAISSAGSAGFLL